MTEHLATMVQIDSGCQILIDLKEKLNSIILDITI